MCDDNVLYVQPPAIQPNLHTVLHLEVTNLPEVYTQTRVMSKSI